MSFTPEVVYEAEEKTYLVMANYLTAGASALPKDYPRVMGTYKGKAPGDAMKQFLVEFCTDVREAQKFFNDVYVIEANPQTYKYQLSSFFGELAEFPNRKIFNDDHMYF